MAGNVGKTYEVLSKVTKNDFTSLISIVCSVDGVCCVIPKDRIADYNYSNASISSNGKLYPKRKSEVGGPITSEMISRVNVEGMPRVDFVRFLNSLGRARGMRW